MKILKNLLWGVLMVPLITLGIVITLVMIAIMIVTQIIFMPYQIVKFLRIQRKLGSLSKKTFILFSSKGKWNCLITQKQHKNTLLIDIDKSNMQTTQIMKYVTMDREPLNQVKLGDTVLLARFSKRPILGAMWRFFGSPLSDIKVFGKETKLTVQLQKR